ncbi:MAG: hypothetical protein K9L32_04560 [Chromatiaceae bacterium]|nr:hypothetical protein [Chromatiaceae bacterium]MCF8003471.1 hypothetical protein [Chromatiaceae bacterium]
MSSSALLPDRRRPLTPEQLSAIDSPLSGVFEVEIASGDRVSLQAAVDRLVRLIQADPNKARLDRLITRWLKRDIRDRPH